MNTNPYNAPTERPAEPTPKRETRNLIFKISGIIFILFWVFFTLAAIFAFVTDFADETIFVKLRVEAALGMLVFILYLLVRYFIQRPSWFSYLALGLGILIVALAIYGEIALNRQMTNQAYFCSLSQASIL